MRVRQAVSAAVTLIALLSLAASSSAASATRVAAARCSSVGKGTAWSYQGQKGTRYTVVGNRPAACAVGIKWLARLTNIVGFPKTPAGWDCVNAVAVVGQCENKSGAIFEWTAKTK